MKGMYQFIRAAWKKPDVETLRARMTEWRQEGTFTVVDKPLRLDRARSLGYKAKKGVIIVRVKVPRGGHKKMRPNKGRRSKRLTNRLSLKMNYKWIGEMRVAKQFKNLEILNSYQVGKDGVNYFFEVICIDPQMPEIKADKELSFLTKNQSEL